MRCIDIIASFELEINKLDDNLNKPLTDDGKTPLILAVEANNLNTTMLLVNNGADINVIKALLGHASLAATQVYMHTTIEHLKEEYKHAHPRAIK